MWRQTLLAVLLALVLAPAVQAQVHVLFFYGYGAGFFLEGGPGPSGTNSHQFGGLAVSFLDDHFRLRAFRGSLERTDLPTHGDNDLDYRGGDVILTGKASHLPFDLGIGASYFEQAFPAGYPKSTTGPQSFVHRWGPHLSVSREHEIVRHLLGWGEVDVHYVPYDRKTAILVADLGLALRW
jgi:hypothetical protein